MNAALLERLQADRAAHRPTVLATVLPTGEQQLIYPREPRPEAVGVELFAAAVEVAARDSASHLEREGKIVFLHPFNPPLRLIVVGAVHIAQPLARMAALTGFSVVIVDPRAAFSTEERFFGVARSTEWPDKALAALAPDARTAVVTLTHDPKLDDPALDAALRSPAFYIGCLGSGKTHASRKSRLAQRGFTDADLARLHGPVGLAINARLPAEIAVSIVAEIVATLHPPTARAGAR